MQSDGPRVTVEPISRMPVWKPIAALVYGLCLTFGIVLVIRGELVDKFKLPLRFTYTRPVRPVRVEVSADSGASWQALEPAVKGNKGDFAYDPGDAKEHKILARIVAADTGGDSYADGTAVSERALLVQYSVESGAMWRQAEEEPGEEARPSVMIREGSQLPVLLRAGITSADGIIEAVAALPTLGSTLLAWGVTLAIIGPLSVFIAWAVLRLAYFKRVASIVTLVFFTLFGLTMIVPFLWMMSTAFKSLHDATLFKIQWIAWPIRWENFTDIFRVVPYGRFYLNSVFIATYVTLGMMLTSSLAAYSFARLDFPGRDKLFLAYLGTMMIPGAVTSIPVFVLMCKIGWVDSYKAIIIPGMFSAYGTFMLRQFFMTLPKDLEDAAKIDGCSLFGIFVKITLPLSKPALATLAIFTFMGSWGDFMWPLIILNDSKKMPLPVGLQFFAASEYPDPNVLMAATMMMIVPVIIVFLLGQRYFVEGIQLGAVKG